MFEFVFFGILYFAWILYRNDELERNERKIKQGMNNFLVFFFNVAHFEQNEKLTKIIELETLIQIAEERNEEIEKKDELIFGLFEQVDLLKDNVEMLQEVSTVSSGYFL